MSYDADLPIKNAGPSKKILIIIPDDLLEEVDRQAKEEGRSRSNLIRFALKEYMERKSKCQISTSDTIDS